MARRPDVPLQVRCTFDQYTQKISFRSALNCSYNVLRDKVSKCFSLDSSYVISYKDDDGEESFIYGDDELTEAIQYFQTGNDDAQSTISGSSLFSSRSSKNKITLHFIVTVDGPSLSDSGSMVSLEEYRHRNGSEHSFSFGAPSIDLDDDAITVSSRDTGAQSHSEQVSSDTLAPPGFRRDFDSSLTRESSWAGGSPSGSSWVHTSQPPPLPPRPNKGSLISSSQSISDKQSVVQSEDYQLEPPSGVFERLKLEDDTSSINHDIPLGNDRGVAWLRDQNERAIRTKLGATPEPSESESLALEEEPDDDSGGLALEQDERGRYYYSYNTASGGSQNLESSSVDENGFEPPSLETSSTGKPRPTSRQLNWLASQRTTSEPRPSRPPLQPYDESIPPEVLQYLEVQPPPEDILTDCSSCGTVLDSMKYICMTCGEKEPIPPHRDSMQSFSTASRTYVDETESVSSRKPLPAIPKSYSPSTLTLPPPSRSGFELCANCIEDAGVHHAIEAGLAPGSSPTMSNWSPVSPEDEQRAQQWRRTAPSQKGQLRHAYLEQIWGHGGWKNIEQDHASFIHCSACSSPTPLHKSYKCASCQKFFLCRACYSQVHDLHPRHAFFVMPEKPTRTYSDPDMYQTPSADPGEEESMVHPDVKCYHCMLDIVGARFHCAICDSVDICSNCDAAGLPGNLDSDDGGHSSSHITIKIPFPLERTEVQTLSRRATYMWTKHQHPPSTLRRPSTSKAKSEISSYARTVIGRSVPEEPDDNHALFCNGCNQLIRGTRFQCASCPSSPEAYNLCSDCEKSSYILHDPHHIFFKLKRPVDRPIVSEHPMVPRLYSTPAGPSNGPNPDDFNDYLRTLTHNSALCDRHMEKITGVWYRCAFCGKDYCDECEAVDTHNDTHIFLVFKSHVDMKVFRTFAELDNPLGSPPVIPYAVYKSSR